MSYQVLNLEQFKASKSGLEDGTALRDVALCLGGQRCAQEQCATLTHIFILQYEFKPRIYSFMAFSEFAMK